MLRFRRSAFLLTILLLAAAPYGWAAEEQPANGAHIEQYGAAPEASGTQPAQGGGSHSIYGGENNNTGNANNTKPDGGNGPDRPDDEPKMFHGAPFISGPVILAPFPPNCGPTTVAVCKTPVVIPYTGTVGAAYTVAMPAPFTNRTFTVQCQNIAGSLSFQVVGNVSCEAPKCKDGEVSVCGASIPIQGGTSLGDTVSVPVPSSVLGASAAYTNSTFTAACVEGADGKAEYQVSDASQISCNQFPCQESSIRLCGVSIPIIGGAQLGEVMNLTMPEPFEPQPFSVSCTGSMGQQPVYQLYDRSAVTCRQKP